jgi:hypothetical protein
LSRSAEIQLTWADGDYRFRLAWKELILLQEACDAGPWFILAQIRATSLDLAPKDMRIEFVSHVLRLGLIGGGSDPSVALKLVRRYVEERPLNENLVYAQAVLLAALSGAPAPDGDEGKSQADAQTVSHPSPGES